MNGLKASAVLIVILFASVLRVAGEEHGDPPTVRRSALSQAMFSFSAASLDRVKTIIKRVHATFSPPNLDFRGREEGREEGRGGGEKVKEAVAESLEKTKATVDDSARSAARIASAALHKTKDKLKRSVSDTEDEQPLAVEL